MEPQTDVIATLLASGPVGVILVAVLLGWIVPRSQVQQMQATIDRLLAERNASQDRERAQAEKVLPLMTRALDLLRAAKAGGPR